MKTNICNKNKRNIIGVLLIATAILCAVFLPFLARAKTAHAFSSAAVFETIRTGTYGSPSENVFKCHNFQRNEANFAHAVTGADIAGLIVINKI